jgi:hypothetical protein
MPDVVDQPASFASAERATLEQWYARHREHEALRIKLSELCTALSAEASGAAMAIEAAEDVLALAQRQHDQNEVAVLLGDPVDPLPASLTVLEERLDQARRDEVRINRAFDEARRRRDDPVHRDREDAIERGIRSAIAAVIDAELDLARRWIPVKNLETIDTIEEMSADVSAATTIEALRHDANATLPPIPFLALHSDGSSEPVLSSSADEQASVASPESAGEASDGRRRRRAN